MTIMELEHTIASTKGSPLLPTTACIPGSCRESPNPRRLMSTPLRDRAANQGAGLRATAQPSMLPSISRGPTWQRIGGARHLMLLLLAGSLALPVALRAQFNYEVRDGLITITRYTGPGGAVTVPSSIAGLPVTRINPYAFRDATSVTSITIPESVTNLLGWGFWGCTNLAAIIVDNLNPSFSSLEGVLFNKAQTTLVTYPQGRTGGYTIPAGVIEIGDWAFGGCSRTTDITIPDSVTAIGVGGFVDCSALISVTIPDSVTRMDGGFRGCGSLTSVVIGHGMTRIGPSMFAECTSLTNVTIPNSVMRIDDSAFEGCTSLIGVTIPGSVTSIGNMVFANCVSVISVEIPGSVTGIGRSVFENCRGLREITFPNSITNLESAVLRGCSSLTNVQIPESVTSIGEWAFEGCSSLTSIVIPDRVAALGPLALSACTNLASVALGNGLSHIADYTFYNCARLTNVTFGGSIASLGQEAFRGCVGLTTITIPNTVTNIGEQAFAGCTGLMRISELFGQGFRSYSDSEFGIDFGHRFRSKSDRRFGGNSDSFGEVRKGVRNGPKRPRRSGVALDKLPEGWRLTTRRHQWHENQNPCVKSRKSSDSNMNTICRCARLAAVAVCPPAPSAITSCGPKPPA